MYIFLKPELTILLAILIVIFTAFVFRFFYYRNFKKNKQRQWLIKAANSNKFVENITQYADGATFFLWSEKCGKLFTHEEAVALIDKALTHDKIKLINVNQLKEYSILV